MPFEALDTFLRDSVADAHLAGAEREHLTAWVLKHLHTDADRNAARKRAFAAATAAVADRDPAKVLEWLEDVLKVFNGLHGPAPEAACSAFFSPGPDCLGQIVNRFFNSRRTVDVCVFTITDDRVAGAMLDAHRRGVKLRVVTDDQKAADLGSDIERLHHAGVPTKADRSPFHMHHKFAIFDGARLLNGSYNWTRGAAEQNCENLIDTGDARLVSAFQKQFDTLWAKL